MLNIPKTQLREYYHKNSNKHQSYKHCRYVTPNNTGMYILTMLQISEDKRKQEARTMTQHKICRLNVIKFIMVLYFIIAVAVSDILPDIFTLGHIYIVICMFLYLFII